jgi:glycosyltransferase involved in cell wall biosynthesis
LCGRGVPIAGDRGRGARHRSQNIDVKLASVSVNGAVAKPRITVIMATYNWSTVLPYAIASVLEQTFTDFELLVIGDGCTDDSEDVVRAIDDPRVEWLGIPRSGHQSGPNNEGIRRARGERIAYLGHDDLWMPEHLALHAASDARLTCSVAAMVGPRSSFIELSRPDPRFTRWVPPSSFVHDRDLGMAWADYRQLTEPPELDLVRRIAGSGARTEVIPRLTVVKFPASQRRHVYRQRPAHEQRAWLSRIRTEPRLEAALRDAASDGRAHRLVRLLSEPSQWRAFVHRRGGSRIRSRQKFKGVR